MCFYWKCGTKVLIGACDISLIISDKNSSKMFLNTRQNYGPSYTDDNLNEAPFTLSFLPWKKLIDEKQKLSWGHSIE